MATRSLIAATRTPAVPGPIPRVRLFDLDVCAFSMEEAVAFVDDLLRLGARHIVFTANVDHVVRSSRDRQFQLSYKAADMVFADGMPLLWAGRLLRRQLRHRVAGVDLMQCLCTLAAARGYRCFFLGAKEETLARACQVAQERFPGIEIAGRHHGFFSDSSAVLNSIRKAKPQLLFVGMGSPRQEEWVAEHRAQLPGVVLTVGGSFEILAGTKKRAPRLLQQAGLEWAWRLGQDPARLWKRYLWDDLAFVKLFFRELTVR